MIDTAKRVKQVRKSGFGMRLAIGYLAANALVFIVGPYGSRWHFGSQDPSPIEVMTPTDSKMSLSDIARTLDAIDLAYGARFHVTSQPVPGSWLCVFCPVSSAFSGLLRSTGNFGQI